MYKQLMQRSAETCEAKGGRILPRLKADPRLTDAAAALQAGQDGLKAKASAYRIAGRRRGAPALRGTRHCVKWGAGCGSSP